jgi:hypothetical protein
MGTAKIKLYVIGTVKSELRKLILLLLVGTVKSELQKLNLIVMAL